MIKGILFMIAVSVLNCFPAYAQDTATILNQAMEIYTGQSADSGVIGGFSVAGLVGGMIFGCIGFVAFMYGKKNTLFVPMLVGLLLMGYPYFVRGTAALYVIGVALTASLYFFRY